MDFQPALVSRSIAWSISKAIYYRYTKAPEIEYGLPFTSFRLIMCLNSNSGRFLGGMSRLRMGKSGEGRGFFSLP